VIDFTMTIRSKDQNSNNQSTARTQPIPNFFTSSFNSEVNCNNNCHIPYCVIFCL